MIPQSQPSPSFRSSFTPHSHIDDETCPWCEQEIPAEKLEEISGKIALREREQSLAIAARLEQKYDAERAEADATAKANLELERRQSAVREAAARDEAKKTAEIAAAERIAAAEASRQQSETALQARIEQEQAAREAAEQASAAHQAQLEKERQENAKALATAKTEAEARETAIRTETQQLAEAAMAEKLAASEMAHAELDTTLRAQIAQAEATRKAAEQKGAALEEQLTALQQTNEAELAKVKGDAAVEAIRIRQEATATAEAALQTKIEEAEATKAAAEQKGAALQEQLTALQQASEAEIAKMKADTAVEVIRIRQEATASAEAAMQTKMTATEQALVEATTKAQVAEEKLNTTIEQQDARLTEQREALEKATVDAVNTEKSKFFEENLKLTNKVEELKRALEKKSNEELGEGAEIDLFEALKSEFPDDNIKRIPKGSPGADIRHIVMMNGKECGTILYDSKNHNQFRTDHVTKLKDDQIADKAEHAILSTYKFPQGARHVHMQDGVVLASPARVVAIVKLIRQHLTLMHTLRVSGVERETKMAELYAFIISDRCTQLLTRIENQADDLLDLQTKEIKWHKNNWEKQGEAYKAIQKAKGDLETDISRILGTAAESEAALEEVQL
jgi:hypothetical protein